MYVGGRLIIRLVSHLLNYVAFHTDEEGKEFAVARVSGGWVGGRVNPGARLMSLTASVVRRPLGVRGV